MESQQILEIVHETNDSGMALCNNDGGREVQGVLDAVLIAFADALGGRDERERGREREREKMVARILAYVSQH